MKGAGEDVLAGLAGEAEVEMEVVDREQAQTEDFLGFHQVAQVGAGEIFAGVALAAFLDRGGVLGERGVFEIEGSAGGEGGAVAGEAGGENAVEHIHTAGDHFEDLRRGAEAHGVARVGFRQEGNGILDGGEHLGFGFADTDTADGVSVESNLHQRAGAFFAEVGVGGALDDSKNERASLGGLGIPPGAAAFRPGEGEVEALVGIGVAAGMRRAFVEKHDDVRAEVALDFHRGLGADEGWGAVEVILETHALGGDFAELREGENLVAAAVRKDRAFPAHEAVEATEPGDEFFARADMEVVGVAEDDLGAQPLEFLRGHRLDRAFVRAGFSIAGVEPRAPFQLDPACAVLHYAQEIFEGLKAYRHPDGKLGLFRPEANAARFNASAERLAMPALPPELFLGAIKALLDKLPPELRDDADAQRLQDMLDEGSVNIVHLMMVLRHLIADLRGHHL